MRRALIGVLIAAACQPLVTIDADPSVAWVAVVTLDAGGEISRATGLLPIGVELPPQPNAGSTLIFGFSADQIDALEPSLSEPVRFAEPCDASLSPIWTAERTDDQYREVSPGSLPSLTASWLGPKCNADRICLRGECVDAIVDIDAGVNTACGRWASGRVSCWGTNLFGQAGLDEYEVYLQTEAALVSGIEGVEELSVGDESTCVRLRGGRVACWGWDYQAEALGMSTMIQGTPREIAGVEDAIGVSSGLRHGCVVKSGGSVECWGRNEHGELGDRTNMASASPVRAMGVMEAVQAAVGASHSCARTTDGRVLCFGTNMDGQLGPGSEPLVEAIGGGALSIDVGVNHSCAVIEGGSVSCWGDNGLGQVGEGDVQLSRPAVAVDLGKDTSCALLEEGGVECWGSTKSGQLGRLESFPFFLGQPLEAPVSGDVIDVAAGGSFTCVLDQERSVLCWGSNAFGAIGNGRSGNVYQREIVLAGDVLKISGGAQITCALLGEGDIQCWGHNDLGQLGRGTQSTIEGPGRVMLAGPAIDVEAGALHACAILEGGDVYCWGANYEYQVGPFQQWVLDSPQRVLGGAIDLAVGDFHSCAILATGEVHCWGWNFFGAVGHDDPATPNAVPFISDAMDGDAGYDQTCIRRRDTTVACWGRDSILEDGFTADRIGLGRSQTCAISGGQVLCWGANDHGQLGDGALGVDHARPAPVLGVSDPRQLIMGSSHVCAVTAAGEVWCWGDDLASELNGGHFHTATPAKIEAFSGVLFGDGFQHACVYLTAGRIECWGWNEWGQVSVELAPIELTPSRVLGLDPL